MHYKSINQGSSWTMIQFLNSDYAFPTPSSLYFIDPENGYYIIKTAYNGNCISFTNDGAHWYYSNIDNNIFVHSDLNSLFLLKGVNN
jgi:hypothetical protein